MKEHGIIRIKMRAFDNKVLDKSVGNIVNAAERSGAKVVGPIPLPNKIERFTVLRSPHVNKKSREQFEMIQHIRIIDIINANTQTINSLQGVELAAGVDIKIKL